MISQRRGSGEELVFSEESISSEALGVRSEEGCSGEALVSGEELVFSEALGVRSEELGVRREAVLSVI